MTDGARIAWVIDDEPSLHGLVGRLLRQTGLTPLSFFDGTEVLAHVEKPFRVPELIHVDITMPSISGFALLRQLRLRTDLARIPVIVASARAEVGDAVLATKFGATLMSKPFHIQRYLSTVEQVLEMSRPMPIVPRAFTPKGS